MRRFCTQRSRTAIVGSPPFSWIQLPPPFWEKKDVTIYNVDLYEFADELKGRMTTGARK